MCIYIYIYIYIYTHTFLMRIRYRYYKCAFLAYSFTHAYAACPRVALGPTRRMRIHRIRTRGMEISAVCPRSPLPRTYCRTVSSDACGRTLSKIAPLQFYNVCTMNASARAGSTLKARRRYPRAGRRHPICYVTI